MYSEKLLQFVSDGWHAENWYNKPEKMDLEDATINISEFIREQWEDLPEDLTPENYMKAWNEYCDYKEMESA